MSPLENLVEQLQFDNRHWSNTLIAIRRMKCVFEFTVNIRVVRLSNRKLSAARSAIGVKLSCSVSCAGRMLLICFCCVSETVLTINRRWCLLFVGSDNKKLRNLSVPSAIAAENKRLQSSSCTDSQGSGSRRKIVRAGFSNFCGIAPPRLAIKRLAAATILWSPYTTYVMLNSWYSTQNMGLCIAKMKAFWR